MKHDSSLNQFIEQYKIKIQEKIEKERKVDNDSETKKLSLSSSYRWEKQTQDVYTNKIYMLFIEEVIVLMYCDMVDPWSLPLPSCGK